MSRGALNRWLNTHIGSRDRKRLPELFGKAKRIAEKEMNRTTALTGLTWHEVFTNDYDLPETE